VGDRTAPGVSRKTNLQGRLAKLTITTRQFTQTGSYTANQELLQRKNEMAIPLSADAKITMRVWHSCNGDNLFGIIYFRAVLKACRGKVANSYCPRADKARGPIAQSKNNKAICRPSGCCGRVVWDDFRNSRLLLSRWFW
jgi:hypothetical protein